MKLKLLFFIPVWKRLRVTEICYYGLRRFIEYASSKAECSVLVVHSEPTHEALAKRFGFNALYAPNDPIGKKFNTGMKHALTIDWNYVFQLNSDDLLDNQLFDVFHEAIKQDKPFASIEKLYLYDTATNEAKEYHYTLNGCGIRIVRRDWIKKAGWQQYCNVKRSARGPYMRYSAGENRYLPTISTQKQWIEPLRAKQVFRLWPEDANKGLDNASRNIMFGTFGEPVGWIRGVNHPPLVVDMKSDTNIWSYDRLQGLRLSSEERDGLTKNFPELAMLQRVFNKESDAEENLGVYPISS